MTHSAVSLSLDWQLRQAGGTSSAQVVAPCQQGDWGVKWALLTKRGAVSVTVGGLLLQRPLASLSTPWCARWSRDKTKTNMALSTPVGWFGNYTLGRLPRALLTGRKGGRTLVPWWVGEGSGGLATSLTLCVSLFVCVPLSPSLSLSLSLFVSRARELCVCTCMCVHVHVCVCLSSPSLSLYPSPPPPPHFSCFIILFTGCLTSRQEAKSVSWTDLLGQSYLLPHWGRSSSNLSYHQVIIYLHQANQS